MTFEELQSVNKALKPMNIKGKEYIPVNERVKAFRMLFPEGSIDTEILKDEDGIVQVKATVNTGTYHATGHAEEERNSSNINRTSAVENCETSAIGRALGLLGIGIDTSIASYEEVTNAQLRQEGRKLASRSEKEGLMATASAKGIDIDMLLTFVGFDRDKQPEGMTVEQYAKAMEYLNKGGK